MFEFIFNVAKILDIFELFKGKVSKNLFYLCNSIIDFLPQQIIKEDKVTG